MRHRARALARLHARALARPLAAAGAVAVLASCGSLTDPAGAGGRPRLERSAALTVTRTPVLFVHGWNSNASVWSTMLGRFRADGWTDRELHAFSYNTAASNATTAAILRSKVDSIRLATGAARVTLVTHSMGTLSARHYVRFLGGDGKVDALVSLGGPNKGTSTAYFCFQTSCTQMWPGSTFLRDLNAVDPTFGTPRYATWWSPCDEVINPDSSTPMDGAANTQTACISHSSLHQSATVYGQLRVLVDRQAQPALLASLGRTPYTVEAAWSLAHPDEVVGAPGTVPGIAPVATPEVVPQATPER